jgi:thiosulfate/3-mercaptopyruvate sulfurtransferase
MQQTFSNWGIDDQVQVVVYDDDGGGYAARLWWMLRYLGHANVALLDGGFSAWKNAGLPIRAGVENRAPREFLPTPHEHMLVQAADVLSVLQDPSQRIIDSRAPQRYLGEEEPLDPIAGRIPGAVNRFWQDNLVDGSRFLDLPTLQAGWQKIVDSIDASNAIVYCGSGVTGCQNVLAMAHAGFGTPKLYAGSWSQWLHIAGYPQGSGEPEE